MRKAGWDGQKEEKWSFKGSKWVGGNRGESSRFCGYSSEEPKAGNSARKWKKSVVREKVKIREMQNGINLEAVCPSKTSVSAYTSTRRYSPEVQRRQFSWSSKRRLSAV
jgi:hypothetical protein